MIRLWRALRRWGIPLLALLLMVPAVVWHSEVLGWLHGEQKYRGHYTNHWSRELKRWHAEGHLWGPQKEWIPQWQREVSPMESWFARFTGASPYTGGYPPLLNGDAEALPVLKELMRDSDARV